ncbi:hypothetical protein HRI_000097100 [Hibiscus trionum]|uniref:C2H2-type domain-containing protein n=1 Tax=Hibiscus trionum TaxID=183268 RepID=A0A9W7LGN2_HIBTR|nr:hypothetical protein HRI_000097100 [Hibiscus trionum]
MDSLFDYKKQSVHLEPAVLSNFAVHLLTFLNIAMNFSRNNSISSSGLSLGNGTIDARFFLSSIDSNLGLISHRVHVHSVINYVPWPAFPLSEVTTTGTELVRSTSTMGHVFAPSSRFGSNHEIFLTQPDHNQSVNTNLLRSVNPTQPDHNQSINTNLLRSMNPTQPDHNQSMNTNLLRSMNPASINRSEVRSNIKRETTGLRSDGRIHSLPGYPQGVYRCSKCLATLYSSQTFAAHVQSVHYKGEGEEARRRRMAARCRRRNLRLRQSSHGHTAVPVSSGGISKRYAARRNNGVAVGVDDVDQVRNGVGAASMRAPLGVVIKEEPM